MFVLIFINAEFTFLNFIQTLGDGLEFHNKQGFSTKDKDNDSQNNRNCAETWKGAWWYR